MSTEIYYFSGTGNSLAVARDIAGKVNGKLISISSCVDQESIKTEANQIGIVFPVYYASNDSGIPPIVGRFAGKLADIDSKYIFAVCTHGGGPGCAIENLSKLLERHGGKLAAGFTVMMSNKNKRPTILKDRQKKLEAICEYIRVRKTGRYETRRMFIKILIAPFMLIIKPVFLHRQQKLAGEFNRPFQELIPLADRSFQIHPKCDGCGICARVCPVSNIEMVDHQPVWKHHCENCLGCYAWCPKGAIYGAMVKYNEKYHHPEVKLSEVLRKD